MNGPLLAVALVVALIGSSQDEPAPGRANRLAKETSPYLLMHAHNPVDWYPWGPEAFERAKAEGRPIFLSIGYSSCYWCHVLDRESFQDEEIAEFLNAHFVCVKVDREERPDVDQVYMTALQAFGGSGGWPMSMFLTPDGRPFFGGTYFPPEARAGMPSFRDVIEAVSRGWTDQRPAIEQDADRLTSVVRRALAGRLNLESVPLDRPLAEVGLAALADRFDPEHAGFGYDPDQPRKPKFPEPGNLAYLLDLARRGVGADDGDRAPLAMVEATLDQLARGGIRDHLGGGYHRYSTERTWSVPHFEKMLYDNAQLLEVHALAFERDGDPRWRAEAEATARFVAREMTAPDGLFYSALDAESEAEEGRSYVWTKEEVRGVLGEDFEAFAAAYGLDGEPNLEGDRYVLRLPKPLDEEADARLAPLRDRLLEARSRRVQPLRDDKSLTAWNGLMIAGLAEGARVFDDAAMRDAAIRAANGVLSTLRAPDGRLLRTARDGAAKLPGYLEDYAYMIHGLLRLERATGDRQWLDQAKALTDRMLADFSDEDQGGFFFTADDHETLLARTKDPYDGALPSPMAVAVRDLIALSAVSGDEAYLEPARRTLEAYAAAIRDAPAATPTFQLALNEYLDRAAPTFDPAVAPPVAAPTGSATVVEVTIEPPPAIRIGESFEIEIRLSVREGWHLNANPASSPTLIPTSVRLAGDSGAELVEVVYPEGEELKLAGQDEPIRVYGGNVTITAKVRVPQPPEGGPVELPLVLRVQACDDRACLAPASIERRVPLTLLQD